MTTPEGKDGKFYMYRIKFQFDEIINILDYWLKNDKLIKVQIDENKMKIDKNQDNNVLFNNLSTKQNNN